MCPTTRTSTRHLSDVARHLVKPSGMVRTGWAPVREKLKALGLGFDVWQQDLAKLILAKRADGLYACTVGGVFLSLPRQVGKTYVLSALVFALCLLNPGMTVLWTAHLRKTTGETHKSWKGLAKRKAIAPFIEAIRSGSGDWEVQFTNGSRILLGAREHGFGRGFAKVDIIVYDEAQILTDKALDDMIPAANASTFPAGALVLYAGTPPTPTDPSEVFSRNRADALAGTSDDMLWVECGADPKVDPEKWAPGFIDFSAIAEANPSYPTRTPRASILRMARQLSRASLRREGLGIWDEGPGVRAEVGASEWSELAIPAAPEGAPAFGVKFSPDGRRVALAAAVIDPDGDVTVEVLRVMSTGDLQALKAWLAERGRSLVGVGVDGRSDAAAFAADLAKLRIPARKIAAMTTAQAIEANSDALARVRAGRLHHTNQPELSASVLAAAKRKIGNVGGWGWEPLPEGDVLPWEAACIATWVAGNGGVRTRKRPGSSGKVVFV